MRLACFISGHGFGHAVRVMEVLRAIWSRRPEVQVAVQTSVPRWFFDTSLDAPFTYVPSCLDVGALQGDSLSLDVEGTLRAYADIIARREGLLRREVAALHSFRPAVILADIPALALEIAAHVGVPGIAMTNFSWDWIYADYVRDFRGYAHVVEDLRRSYGAATLLLRLPLHGDLSAFPRIRDIPFVARKATCDAADVRRRLQLPVGDRIVLLSFGGIGITLAVTPRSPAGVTFVATQSAAGTAPPSCRLVTNAEMAAAGVRYEDLVAACDAVMTKPGYGIVSDCIANGTPMVYTSRGRFAEYACLVEGIEEHLPHAFISNEDLYAGRWLPALDALFAQPRRVPRVNLDGAAAAAEVLLSFLDSSGREIR